MSASGRGLETLKLHAETTGESVRGQIYPKCLVEERSGASQR
jgi:hypothetical protein